MRQQIIWGSSGWSTDLFVKTSSSSTAFPGGSDRKNLPAMRETWVRRLCWEDPLGEGVVTHFSPLAWRTRMQRGAWRAIDNGVAESDMTERLGAHTHRVLLWDAS